MAGHRLSERIVIQEYLGEIQNNNGFDEPTWGEYYSCWCEFREVSGKEFIAAKSNNSEDIVTFTIRYCNKVKALLVPGSTKKFKVVYKDVSYDIEFCSDFNNLHEWVDIKAEVKG